VCVCERERERETMCVFERESVWWGKNGWLRWTLDLFCSSPINFMAKARKRREKKKPFVYRRKNLSRWSSTCSRKAAFIISYGTTNAVLWRTTKQLRPKIGDFRDIRVTGIHILVPHKVETLKTGLKFGRLK